MNIMEILALFGIVSSLVLSIIIANAGAKRQIGFGWSLFLGLWLTPIVSLIAVLLSDRLKPNEYDRIEKKWGCIAPFIVSFLIIGTVAYIIYSYSDRDKQKVRTSIEFSVPEVLKNNQSQINSPNVVQPAKQNKVVEQGIAVEVLVAEPSNSAYDALTKKSTNPANEIEVDLNNFLGTSDDETDWNSTELSEEYCKTLARQKIYYSVNKGAWVKEKNDIVENEVLEEQNVIVANDRNTKEQNISAGICNIVHELQGRQVEIIASVTNNNSIAGFIIINIEVTPEGKVINCDIDKRSVIESKEIREECISASNTKFNSISSNKNQNGIIRYMFSQ